MQMPVLTEYFVAYLLHGQEGEVLSVDTELITEPILEVDTQPVNNAWANIGRF